jgi:GNAT superfamily N-acetyltransferase
MTIETSFVSEVTDLPEFEALLLDYYKDVLQVAEAAGLPKLAPEDIVASSIDHLDEMLPPNGRLALARDAHGRLVGCATLRRIRPDAVEMKRMYVRPEARGNGLGQQLFEMRIQEAKRMGCRAVYADTAKGNRPMLSMYERFGFRYVSRYPENANLVEYEPYLVYLEYIFDQDAGSSEANEAQSG